MPGRACPSRETSQGCAPPTNPRIVKWPLRTGVYRICPYTGSLMTLQSMAWRLHRPVWVPVKGQFAVGSEGLSFFQRVLR